MKRAIHSNFERIYWHLHLKFNFRNAIYCRRKNLIFRCKYAFYKFRFHKSLEDFKHKCLKEDIGIEATTDCIIMFGTLKRVLRKVFKKIGSYDPKSAKLDLRNFRGLFCKETREFRKLSKRQLCYMLNAHPEIPNYYRQYPCFFLFYPFTPKFLTQFEDNTSTILELCTSGFLAGVGFPTREFAKLVSNVCQAEKEFVEFENLYSYAHLKKLREMFPR